MARKRNRKPGHGSWRPLSTQFRVRGKRDFWLALSGAVKASGEGVNCVAGSYISRQVPGMSDRLFLRIPKGLGWRYILL